ncbi:MAG TPA: hypothetical protein VGQ17_06780 [Gemmatimonadales bacterium]|nr:hypothetical protein [Gemmatimonadales bacterium]
MAASSRKLLLFAALTLLAPAARAQSRVAGRVVRLSGGDTLPVPGAGVVLHRVARAAQGPVDTARADGAGRFQLRFAADTGAVWLLSSRFAGIEYFSQPLSADPARPDTGLILVVADTSSRAPVALRQRTILVSRPDESGTRTVVDWFVLTNPGQLTRVAPDTLRPSWSTALPEAAQAVELAEAGLSQFSPDAVVFRRDSALLFAPLSAGDKELMLQYRIPGTLRRFTVPFGGPAESVFVLLEEPPAGVAAPGFSAADSQLIEGRPFRRWVGPMRAAGGLDIVMPAPLLSSGQLLALLVAAASLGFLVLAWYLLRRAQAAPAAAPHPLATPASLADQVARLDARYLDHRHEVPPEEWARYVAERDRLKERLVRALAAIPRRS